MGFHGFKGVYRPRPYLQPRPHLFTQMSLTIYLLYSFVKLLYF